ncbi:MAG: anthranilate phosphoribosyltransferase [Anaerolineae bacterium]|nr:anthranilate phosphoribosyltransferase [Anaerolineae bacterium]
MSIQHAISRLARHEHLTADEAEAAMDAIMSGDASPAQIGGFLMALRMKGETVDEIAGSARAMRRAANQAPVHVVDVERLIDTCGTGGDGAGTFNISTTVAFVVAGAGLPVAKHGNRSVSSKSGSADVLAALGVNLNLTPPQVGECIDAVGIGFLFAPTFHPAMRHAIGPRRELAVRTLFNVLGPLTNPAGARRQLMGVYDPALTEPLARVLLQLGAVAAFVVHGDGGLDELTTTGPNRVSELCGGEVNSYTLDPAQLGLPRAKPEALIGGDPAENARITRGILDGSIRDARRDVTLLNAAAALVAGGLAHDLPGGLELAARSIDSGAALGKLDALIAVSQQKQNVQVAQ